jgi:hypothetical protein
VADCWLRLYIAGQSVASRRAEKNVLRLKALLGHDCRVEVIDVHLRPSLAEAASILATPTLSYDYDHHSRRVIGDLSDVEKVAEFLGLERKKGEA